MIEGKNLVLLDPDVLLGLASFIQWDVGYATVMNMLIRLFSVGLGIELDYVPHHLNDYGLVF